MALFASLCFEQEEIGVLERLMDGARDQYEERLKEVFESFDGSGLGSLSPEELTDLCRALQLEENTLNTLLHTLLQDQISARVDFEQFKDVLILVLSSTNTDDPEECLEQPDSPEVQPRFVKGSKRYGRRTAPEFIHTHTDSHTQAEDEEEKDEDAQESDDRTVPRKRERWNADMSISEEFEAEGQMHLWNPDEPSTPRGNAVPLCDLEERLQNACHQLSLPINGMATLKQLHTLCQRIGIEVGEDLLQGADESLMDVQEFISCIINHSKPPTPSVSTPYRQLKRHHSTQFDESGRRISCALSSTIGLQVFSDLDDGSGHAPVETLLYRWMEEGVDNSSEILQALDFNLEGKVNLSELTVALENELLSTKNSIHQAALVSFKAEIRHLLECVDLERREKERIRFDLDKAEKLKSQLASEVDDHHAGIERNNELNIRKLEQEYKESMTALKVELSREVELVQQQANQQREELEQGIGKMKDDETFLREHLTLTIKENSRLESELIETTEKLVEAENQLNKVQSNLDGVLKEKFGDLDPDSAEFYQQEERLRHLRRNYEEQCRELQDRIDELEAQLEEYQTSGHTPSTRLGLSLSDELASKSSGSQERQPLNMSLETEMLLEQHQQEIENIRAMVYEEKRSAEEERSHLSLQHQQEVQVLREEMARELERANKLEKDISALQTLHQQELQFLTQEAQEARSRAEQLEAKVQVLEEKQTAHEEQSRVHAEEMSLRESKHQEVLEASLQEQRERLQEEKEKEEMRLTEQWKQEQKSYEEVLSAQLEEMQQRTEQECVELEKRLREEWERERQELEESSKEALQAVLEERERRLKEEWEQEKQELVDISREALQAALEERERRKEEWEREKQELEEISKEALQAVLEERLERERRLRQQWDEERASLENKHHALLLQRLQEEREHLRTQQEENESIIIEHWGRERAQMEKQHEEALQACLEQERERLHVEREEQERRWQQVLNEEQGRMEEAHKEAMQELCAKHSEERERISSLLEKLRTDIAEQRRELQKQFSQRLEEVEVRFNGDQEAVSKRFEADVHKLEQHYQSEIAALAQQHAADRAHWKEESEAATKEAEQQWKLLREALKTENQCLELAHAQDIKALIDKNLQLQAELEVFVSAARTKEIELSRQLNELHKDRMEAKDLLLAQAENKATELEEMLKQAVDDFIQERAELQWSLSALESRRGEVLSFTESMELKGTIQEGEELLCQEIKIQRKALLAERDALALRVLQLEGIVLQLTGTTAEPSAELLGEPCVESTEGIHAESTGDNCEETPKESTVQPFGELNQYTCTESTDEVSPKHLICEESSVNRDNEEEAGIMDEVTDSGLGDPQQHRCLEIGVTNDITSNSCADELDMSDVESNNNGTEPPDCACLIEEKEKTEENLSNPGVDGSEDAALNEELQNAERNSTESQRDDTLEMAEEDILNGTEIEAQILVENEASYNQESLQHHESPSTDDTLIEYNCKPLEPVIEDDPEVGIGISSLENEIRAFAYKVCSLTTVDTELDKVADFRDVYIQEILDLQETVMQYSKAAEGTSSQLQSPKRQYLDKENIIHQVPNRLDQMEATIKDVQLAELKICFEQSIQENLQLVERNRNLEKRVKSLEGKMHVVLDLHKQQASVLEKTAQLGVEYSKLKVLLQELDKQDKVPQWDSDSSDTSNNSPCNSQLKEKIAAVAELEFFCMEFEKQNLQLRRELADLQDKSLRIHEQMQERRSEVCRLAKENFILRHKISTVREEDLRENQDDLRLQHMKQGKRSAQALRRQLSEPRRLGQQLEEENILVQQNADHVLRHALQEVMRHHDSSTNEKNGFCDREEIVSRTEKDLLRSELNRCIEKVMSLDSSLQTLTQQNVRLKSDLRITQQERDALKQEVISLHKKLQYANERLLEVSVVSAGQQQGRRVWEELSGLMEVEHASLTEENQQLKRQMSEMSSELQTSKDQIRHMEALSVKQRGLVKTADQEKSALKHELEALHTQLLSTRNKAHLSAVLPSSPLQFPGEQRGQHYSDGPDFNMQQDEREMALLQMEERMREVELMLRNLKLLLQEKVSQLKEQLIRNSESDVLIKDLYVENAQLLKTLEKTEQRQKVAEKKNFLLEEKISSLNKIVRDLGPSPLTPAPYHFTRS
ncbi:ninein isoform X2 [Rhinichthys klamathensis goyatoka]|uniref:ninein isoform X2 n=1 Tax=Rhinichthys klamathensis goyatoka TaxID=3034132 RepID=UPI0024B5C23C|nr:ninein isoform X2 [Rhinichthys klamathensis goyatoka]